MDVFLSLIYNSYICKILFYRVIVSFKIVIEVHKITNVTICPAFTKMLECCKSCNSMKAFK